MTRSVTFKGWLATSLIQSGTPYVEWLSFSPSSRLKLPSSSSSDLYLSHRLSRASRLYCFGFFLCRFLLFLIVWASVCYFSLDGRMRSRLSRGGQIRYARTKLLKKRSVILSGVMLFPPFPKFFCRPL